MRRVFEFSHNPKLLPGDDAIDVVGNKVVNLVVCHRADDNIVIVRNAMAAVDEKQISKTKVTIIVSLFFFIGIPLSFF